MYTRHPPWYADVKKQQFPRLSGEIKTEVAVIGGGITGTSTAYHLASRGIGVTLLEANTICSGASSKNFGMLVLGTEHDFVEAVKKFGLKRASSAWFATNDALLELAKILKKEKIECGLERTSSLNVALHERNLEPLQKEYRSLKKAGFKVKWFEGNALQRIVHSPLLLAAVYSPYDSQVLPTKLVQGLARTATQKDAIVFEHSRVLSIRKHKDVFHLRTRRGVVIAEKIIFATETSTPVSWLPANLHIRRDFGLATAKLPKKWFDVHWPGKELFWNFGVHYHAFRKFDNRILFFGTEGARRSFQEFFPKLKMRATHNWRCRVAGFPDQWPRIGPHSKHSGVYFSAGYRGHGLVFGFMAGNILAEHIAGKKNKWYNLFKP